MDSDRILLPLQQAAANWQPDLPSILLGLALGVLLTLAVWRLLPIALAWRERAVNRFRETQAWVRSGVEARFQAETAAFVQKFHLGGDQADLASIYVEPLLLEPRLQLDGESPIDPSPEQLFYFWPDLASGGALPPPPAMRIRTLLLSGRRVLVSAEPGAGKTTLLAYCAYLCANAADTGPYTFLLPKIPVFLHAADLDLAAPGADEDPLLPASLALQERSGPLTSAGVAALLREKMEAGRVLFLLDGLDELSTEAFAAAASWLQTLLKNYPDTQMIVAAPLSGYGPLLELEFIETGFLPWRAGQAEQFGRQWSAVLEIRQPALPNYWRPGSFPFRSSLRLWLGQEEAQSQVGERWVELLEASLRRYLPTGDDDPAWLAPAVRELWQQIAYRLITEEQASLSRPALLSLIESVLAEYEVEDKKGAALLEQNVVQSPLFSRYYRQAIGFRSPLWRDFLAATHLVQLQEEEEAVAHLSDPAWSGLLYFYVGRAGAGDLAAALLENQQPDPLYANLFRAAGWLSETVDQGEWRRQTLIRLGQLIIKANLPLLLRQRATLALAQCGEPGVLAFMKQLLRQPDPTLRQAAIAGLGVQESELVLDLLIKMLDDGEADVRRAVIFALAWLNDPATEKPLLTALIERDEVVNRAVAEALALSGGEAYELLREALQEDMLHVRRAAVHGLALLDEYWAVELLENAEREDDQWVVKSAATAALEAISARNRPAVWRPPQAGEQGWLITWAAKRGQAVPGGQAALPLLLEVLADGDDAGVRINAAASLGLLAAQEGIAPLRKALHDSDEAVREAAFVALCRIQRVHGAGLTA